MRLIKFVVIVVTKLHVHLHAFMVNTAIVVFDYENVGNAHLTNTNAMNDTCVSILDLGHQLKTQT